MNLTTLERGFDYAILVVQCLMVILIPIIFTSATASVFEINKLLILRIGTTLMAGLWLIKRVTLGGFGCEANQACSLKIRKHKKKLEEPANALPMVRPWDRSRLIFIALVGFLLASAISTTLSVNPTLAWMGSYDRWNGLLTILHYGVLLAMFIEGVAIAGAPYYILGSMIIASACTAFYGMAQRWGIDLLQWASDASQRVFSTVNSPVHY